MLDALEMQALRKDMLRLATDLNSLADLTGSAEGMVAGGTRKRTRGRRGEVARMQETPTWSLSVEESIQELNEVERKEAEARAAERFSFGSDQINEQASSVGGFFDLLDQPLADLDNETPVVRTPYTSEPTLNFDERDDRPAVPEAEEGLDLSFGMADSPAVRTLDIFRSIDTGFTMRFDGEGDDDLSPPMEESIQQRDAFGMNFDDASSGHHIDDSIGAPPANSMNSYGMAFGDDNAPATSPSRQVTSDDVFGSFNWE